MRIVKRTSATSPWLALISFLITVVVATVERWSAQDLAWSFWLAGLALSLIYLVVYQMSQGDRETLAYPFLLLFFYLIFAAFLDTVFAFAAWDVRGAEMPALFADVPTAIAHAVRRRWPFLLTSGLAMLPGYILDARTVNFADLSKPLFAKDLLRMVVLVFILMALTMARAGMFALYAVLLVYFLPWEVWRRLIARARSTKS